LRKLRKEPNQLKHYWIQKKEELPRCISK
jgi:hypothetical protein